MAKHTTNVFVLLYFSAVFLYFGCDSRPAITHTQGEPWPMPQSYVVNSNTLSINEKTFTFKAVAKSCSILEAAFERYFRLIFYPPVNGIRSKDSPLRFKPAPKYVADSQLMTLEVVLMNDCEDYPHLQMDESYDLSVMGMTAKLNAKQIWGALRGLETFSQIVYQNDEGMFLVNGTQVNDFPRFSHRGVLLDTSRHFLSKEVIMQNLEAMEYNKLNVFHWHIVDDQSFPYQSKDFPDLSAKGAYDPYTHIYSQEDVAEIIEFARIRGIRVVPEFDSPGHSQSWGPGTPGLLTECYSSGKFDGSYGPINPITNSTYDFLKGFFKELTSVFQDKYIHLGGDEVSFSCWESNPQITTFMQKMGYGKDYSKLEEYYMQNLLNIVGSYNSGYIIWQEVIDNGCKVRPDTVVHVWKGNYQSELYNVTKMGLHALISSPWYLDYISYAEDWQKYYTVEPTAFNGSPAQVALLMGGEACLWGEYVDNTNVVSRLWPRASAIAERLWSAKEVNNAKAAAPRLHAHRCRMLRRGIQAEPQTGPGFCQYEW